MFRVDVCEETKNNNNDIVQKTKKSIWILGQRRGVYWKKLKDVRDFF